MVVRIPHKRTDKICNLYGQNLRIICYCVLGINWLQIINIMTRETEIIRAAQMCARNYGGENLVELAFKKGAEWADAHQPSPWISVNDRLPEKIKGNRWSKQIFVRYEDTRGGIGYDVTN